jgi:hypothetical protein
MTGSGEVRARFAFDRFAVDALPASRLALNSRVLGLVETALPEWARDNFFRFTGASGVARAVFLDGAIPKV